MNLPDFEFQEGDYVSLLYGSTLVKAYVRSIDFTKQGDVALTFFMSNEWNGGEKSKDVLAGGHSYRYSKVPIMLLSRPGVEIDLTSQEYKEIVKKSKALYNGIVCDVEIARRDAYEKCYAHRNQVRGTERAYSRNRKDLAEKEEKQ